MCEAGGSLATHSDLNTADTLYLAVLPPDALSEHRHAFKQAYGLDKPLLVQYWRWISRAIQGDLGKGIQHKMAVSELIWPRLMNSLKLATVAIALAICLALPLG